MSRDFETEIEAINFIELGTEPDENSKIEVIEVNEDDDTIEVGDDDHSVTMPLDLNGDDKYEEVIL